MNYKPTITYFGSNPLFRSLEAQLTASIPLDTCEWKRSYGRPNKNVRIDAQFQPFEAALLQPYRSGDWSILEHPVLHVYITDCCDVDAYKSTIKEEIDGWLRTLQANGGITDWMILLVETVDSKKSKNLLPRTTVLDKLRLDFGTGKHAADRCVSVLNPIKYEVKATESFRCLLNRLRTLMLVGFNRNICKYEELIRAHREKRNQPGWCFVRYFGLQEQLAFVLEMLGLHQEALLQYDELDAMFAQFVQNADRNGDRPEWLRGFEQRPLHQFHGITLNVQRMAETRRRLASGAATVLEFRSYVFERQTVLLAAADQHWEIAERFLPFVFGTLREVEVLRAGAATLASVDGALECWQFVCAIEVLQLCDAAVAQETGNRDATNIFQYTAAIWNLAKDRLYELGDQCGLLPGRQPTSEQLHAVVQLSAGIGDSLLDEEAVLVERRVERGDRSPAGQQTAVAPALGPATTASVARPCATDRLKEALGSNEAFTKLFLELSELAISTYKHVSQLRSARLVGLDLGRFYCALGEPHKAVVFFTDLLRELKAEQWPVLVGQTLLQLAGCYRSIGDTQAYTKTCAAIACCVQLDETEVRVRYFAEFQRALRDLKTARTADSGSGEQPPDGGVLVPLEDHFRLEDVRVLRADGAEKIIQDEVLNVEIRLVSNFPRDLVTTELALSYELVDRDAAAACATDSGAVGDALSAVMLPMSIHLDFKQDNTLDCASVVCDTKNKHQLVRRSSSTRRKVSPTTRNDFTNHVAATNVTLKPGANTVTLRAKATRVGTWNFRQLSITVDPLEFLTESTAVQLLAQPSKMRPFEVTTKAASALLSFKNLIAGLPQPLSLIVSAGSHVFAPHSQINIRCSKNLLIRPAGDPTTTATGNPFRPDITLQFDQFRSFEERTVRLEAVCELPGQRDDKPIEHTVTLQCPWSRQDIPCALHFMPPITASCRLHSSETRKFLQIIIKGSADVPLSLSEAAMACDYRGVRLTDKNPTSQQHVRITRGLSVSYLWEIEVEPLLAEGQSPVIKVQFGLRYACADGLAADGTEGAGAGRPADSKAYTCKFDVSDYATLFRIQAKVDASELCRVGSVCQLSLRISKVQESPYVDLMYEVMADQNIWAVCGRSAGVVSMRDIESQSMILDVLPLSAGFLPMPNIRLSKYIAVDKSGAAGGQQHPKLQPFPPGQVYNATKSMQIHVLAGAGGD